MSIVDEKCEICKKELDVENYYYISTGRLQQGIMSNPNAYKEYTLCRDCYTRLNADLLVSINKLKNQETDQ